ncbi:MAG TPA: TolC family protein [Gemmataceae bacterium]|nr:TolC family protein [Gemmataceae bacterium]
MKPRPRIRGSTVFRFTIPAGLLGLILCAVPVRSEPNAAAPPPEQPILTLNAAVQWALKSNPALATFRRNRGIAEAAVQIARQYPFNPIIQHYMWGDWGPAAAGVTNHFFQEHTSRLDLEINGQGKYRRAAARAALTRTEWEIAAQELLTSITLVRAFNTSIYRQGKYRLLEEAARLTEDIAASTKQLVENGTLRSADLLLARADVVEARNALGPARGVMIVAENDLRRSLGIIGEPFQLQGTLEKDVVLPDPLFLTQAALERRPDLHGFEIAVREAENRLRFEIANRWGNPSLGPSGEVNETSVGFVGLWLIWQAPIINTRKGEIRQRQAELARAAQAVHQSEIQVRQDVMASWARLTQAKQVVKNFRTDTLPTLRKTLQEFDKLYLAGQPGVDLSRLISIRRRLLTARDAYLDALWELSQAQTDLAAAVADLSFAGCRAAPPESEGEQLNQPSPTQQPSNGEELPPPMPVPGK